MSQFGFSDKSAGARQKVLILGGGVAGLSLAQRLCREDRQVVVVDKDPDRLSYIQNLVDVQTVQGSASSPGVLKEAGAETADIVAAITGSDEINLLACALANILNPTSVKLARINSSEYSGMEEIYRSAAFNIQAMINPDVEVVHEIERMLKLPVAVDYGEFANGRVKIIAMEIGAGPLIDVPILNFRKVVTDQGVRIGGILRGESLFVPSASDRIRSGDVVYFVCLESSIQSVFSACGVVIQPVKHICIIGGGELGLMLALRLEELGTYSVSVVEKNRYRCKILAEHLSHTLILQGDATDKEFMIQEDMSTSDMIIALTGDDETNIMACLMGRQLGARQTITRINKRGYMPLVRSIGLRLSVNPRIAATNSMVYFLRRGLLLSTLATRDEEVEMVEALITAGSAELEKPLKKSTFPARTNLLAVMRGDDVFIPSGDTVLQPDDRVVLMCDSSKLSWVDECLIGRNTAE